MDADGERVGEHRGAAGYTVGQRQGLGVALGEPRYVSAIDPADEHDHARPARGSRDEHVRARARAFVAGDAPAGAGRAFRAEIRIRHRADAGPGDRPAGVPPSPIAAALDRRDGRPVWAAAPGQAAVLYDGEVVLGGGRIAPAPEAARVGPSGSPPASGPARRVDRPGARPRRPGRHLPRRALRPHPGPAGGRLPLLVGRRDPRRVGRRRARRPARASTCSGSATSTSCRVVVAWIGIGSSVVAALGPRVDNVKRRSRDGEPDGPMSEPGARRPARPDDLRTFVRGLTIGVLVGAAIAGSRMWRRLMRRPPGAR